jgi:hypothetical protein
LVEVIVALTLSKLVIVAALALAGGALASQEGFGTLIAGAGMLLLAAFAPFALFKLVPIASMAGIASLEGLSRRAPRAVAPRLANVAQSRHLAAVNALPAASPAHRSLPPGSPGATGGPLPPPPPPPGSAVPATHGRSVGGGGVPASAAGVTAVGAGATALVTQTRRQFEQTLPFPEPETEQR